MKKESAQDRVMKKMAAVEKHVRVSKPPATSTDRPKWKIKKFKVGADGGELVIRKKF